MRARGAQKTDWERGQASVELLGVLPAALLVVLLAWQLALAGHATWLAGSSARVAARAAAVGRDPTVAARSAVPEHLRRHLRVRRSGDRVLVSLRPPLVLWRWSTPFAVGGSAAMESQEP
jgi:type IV secretory pathway TrbD component